MITKLTISSYGVESKNKVFYVKGTIEGTHFKSDFKWSGKKGVDDIKLKGPYFKHITEREFNKVCEQLRIQCMKELEEKVGEHFKLLFDKDS